MFYRERGWVMNSSPDLKCGCLVGRCHLCMACRRCGCEHDGVEVAEKASKRRGQRSVKFKNDAKKKQKRQANTYERGSFFESPITPNTRSGRFTLSSAFPSTNPDVLAPQSERVADLLQACGVEDKVDYIYAHMHPAKQRSGSPFGSTRMTTTRQMLSKALSSN